MSSLVITPLEVESVMKCLPLGNAVGPDGIKYQTLWECSHELSHPLCFLINHSLSLGISLKRGKMLWCVLFTKNEICHLFLIIRQFPPCRVWKR